MPSKEYFEFLGTVWDSFKEKDRDRFGETWKGYEQVFAAEFQKFMEHKLNCCIDIMQPYKKERWVQYTFNGDNTLTEAASLRGTQDLSVGINLTSKYLLNLSYDGAAPKEVDLRGSVPALTTIEEIIEKINLAFGITFAAAVVNNALLELSSPTTGIDSSVTVFETSIPGSNASEFVLGILPEDTPYKVPEFSYVYSLPDDDIVDIEVLRTKVRRGSKGLYLLSGTDYEVIGKNKIAFREEPPEELWAEVTIVDDETPWNNFGFLMDIYQPNSPRYLEVLRGLWFAFWNGAKPQNVQSALYLLFSLPTAVGGGTISAVTSEEIVLVLDKDGTEVTYAIPAELVSRVAVGDTVVRFEPLVTGIEVYDKINRPGFIKNEIGRVGISRFLTENATKGADPSTDESKALELLEEHTFLPQIAVESFVTPDINLGNVRIFLEAIQPLAKTYLFQVIVGEFTDEVGLEDRIGLAWTKTGDFYLDTNPSTYIDEATLEDHEETVNEGLRLDPHVLSFGESVEFEVRSFGSLIDSFTI